MHADRFSKYIPILLTHLIGDLVHNRQHLRYLILLHIDLARMDHSYLELQLFFVCQQMYKNVHQQMCKNVYVNM